MSQTVLNGTLEILKGDVKVNDQAITSTVNVKPGDKIVTAAGAEAQLNYPDGSGFLIKEKTAIEVKETRGKAYIKKDGSPGTSVDWLLVDLKKGNIFGALATNPNVKEESQEKITAGGKLLASLNWIELIAAQDKERPWYQTAQQKKVKVKVDMPWGVAAVRGSFWQNSVTGTGCSTSLLEGEAELTAGGQSVSLLPGTSSTLSQANAAPTPPAPMSAAEVNQWVQQATWLQNTAQQIQANQPASPPPAGITAPNQQQSPAPAPAVPNILNTVNQALIQAQQQAGFTNNPNNPPANRGGGGTNSNTGDSGSSSTAALWTESFEGDINGWELNTDGVGLWNVVSNNSGIKNGAVGTYVQLPEGDASEGSLPSTPFGSRCLWYGKTNSTNPYEVGNFLKEQVAYDQPMEGGHSVSPHRDYAVSPVITIPGATNREYILSFSSWWEIEAVNPYSFDMMNVYIVDGEKSILLDTINPKYSYLQDVTYQNNAPLAFTSGGYNTPGVWKTYQYNLTEYMGKSIKLKFEFNTGDTNYNAFRGWFIDQLKLTQMVSKPGNVSGKVLDYTAGSAGNGIQNISVQLLNKDYEVVATTLSSTDGSYSFSGIAPGNYCVSVESPLGYDNYSQLIKVTVMPGQTTAGNDFYLRALTPSITYVSTPYYCEYSGKDQQIEVTIFTIAIAEGTEINVQLLNEDKQAVVGVSSVSAIVGSDNAAMTNLTIPQNTPCGYYYIRASINGVDPYEQSFVITDGWTAIGNSLTAAADSGLGLIVGTTNANLAFTDGNGYAKVYTNTLEGSTNWTLMGDALNTNGALVDLSIWNGAALAAYRNESGVPTVASFVYDVGPWTTLTGGTVPTGTADSLSLDVGGVDQLPYLAYKNSGSIYTYAYGPGGWQPMASEFSGASPSGTLSINAASGKPYLAYLNDSNKVTVRVYVYGNWQTISGSGWTGAGSLALTTDGENLYIAYSEQTAERGLVMKGRYKETGWDWEGPLYFSDNKIDNISLAWYGDHLYVAYSDEDQNGKLVVKYLDGTDWIPIEIEGWGQDSVAETRIRVTSNGIYVLYEVGSGYVTLLRHNLPVIS